MRIYIDELKKRLLYELKSQKKGGIYGFLQRTMAYNSNRIEGSTLTERQTAFIFETGTILQEENMLYRTKDIEEMTGHFRMFNRVVLSLEQPLDADLIKKMHYDLKVGVFEDMANGYPCGEYKNRQNIVSDIKTALPKEVPVRMDELLNAYHEKKEISLSDLSWFHAEYESIHPFQDGNGRTGRMILFRESLKHHMVPVVIDSNRKAEYYAYLNLAQKSHAYEKLTEFFEEQQKWLYAQTKDLVLPIDMEKI